MIVLGGGMIEAMPDLIREEVEAGICSHSAPAARKALKVVTSTLKDHAVTTGAAKLAWDIASSR
jgi:hypothetical protein